MGHVMEHCHFPRIFYRFAGSVWVCTCGKVYTVRHSQSGKVWELIGEE